MDVVYWYFLINIVEYDLEVYTEMNPQLNTEEKNHSVVVTGHLLYKLM